MADIASDPRLIVPRSGSLIDQGAGWFASRDGLSWAGERMIDCIAIIILIIHTTAPVAILTKLAPGGDSPIAGYVWLAGAVLGIGLAALKPVRAFLIGAQLVPFVLLTVWVGATLLWSFSPYDTLRGAIYLVTSHLTAVALAARYSWPRLLAVITLALALTVLPGIGLVFGAPQIGVMQEVHPGAWSGLWMEKQFMGFYACQLIICAICLVIADRRWWPVLFLIPFGVAGIIGATGRTAMVMAVIALATIPVVWYLQGGRRRMVVFSWLAVVGGAALALAINFLLDDLLLALGRGADLSGRTDIWREVEVLIAMHPLQGYGYQAIFRNAEDPTSPYQWLAENSNFTPANAHSSWLEAQLGLGLIGLVLLVACVVMVWVLVLLFIRRDGAGSVFSVATLLSLTVVSFTESTLLNQMDLQWLFFVLIAAKMLAPDPPPPPKPVDINPLHWGVVPVRPSDSMGRSLEDGYEYTGVGRT